MSNPVVWCDSPLPHPRHGGCPGLRAILASNVARALARHGMRARHSSLFGRRPGMFIRQVSDAAVTVRFDYDTTAEYAAGAAKAYRAAVQSGYLVKRMPGALPAFHLRRPAE